MQRQAADASLWVGTYGALSAPYLYFFQTCRADKLGGAGQRFFDVRRYRCVMMSRGREQRREARSKEEGRDEDTTEDNQDNNGTKMATTCSAVGRPLASTLPSRWEELKEGGELVPLYCPNRMTAGLDAGNRHANISRHHRQASKVSSPSTLAFSSASTCNALMSDSLHSGPVHLS